jgi:hypothetical protein
VQWKKWNAYLLANYPSITQHYHTLPNDTKLNLIIAYMSHLYDTGSRGTQIISQMTGIKQIFLIEGADISFFQHPKYLQACKSCRYVTVEIHKNLNDRIYNQQLPITFDMVVRARQILWNLRQFDTVSLDNKAVYLCIALSYDTGRRISNFTHQPKTFSDDHCIKTSHVHFIFKPHNISIPAGPSFRVFVRKECKNWDTLSHALLYFFSQKEGARQKLNSCVPIKLTRSTPNQEQLLIDLAQWCVSNDNDGEEELLTRCLLESNRSKRLIRMNVTKALKTLAVEFDLDPKRISTRSLRSGYATVSNLLHKDPTSNSNHHIRAGWTKNSKVPSLHYDKSVENQGALSYPDLNYNIDYINQLNPKR